MVLNQVTMKKLILVVSLLLVAPALCAADIEAPGSSSRKLQRGFLNIALSPLEVAHQLEVAKKKESMPPSWVVALFKGGFAAVGRSLVGVYEILTFGVETPSNYAPIVTPEFTWEYFQNINNQETSTKAPQVPEVSLP